jgi:hypothetical protein
MKRSTFPFQRGVYGGVVMWRGAHRSQDDLEALAARVYERVVGHHRLGRLESELGESRERTFEHAGGGLGVLARMELDVGEARVVVDDAMQVLDADRTRAPLPISGNAMSRRAEAGEPLDVDVQERSRPRPLVAPWRRHARTWAR